MARVQPTRLRGLIPSSEHNAQTSERTFRDSHHSAETPHSLAFLAMILPDGEAGHVGFSASSSARSRCGRGAIQDF
jgi:hypothetical protein